VLALAVRESIINSFKSQVLKKPYDKITIGDICEAASVARTVFYTYFDNKHDLLCRIIYDELMEPILHIRSALPADRIKSAQQLIMEQIYCNILANKEFYSRINIINNHMVLTSIITEQLDNMNSVILQHPDVSELEARYFTYFCAAAQAMLICKWIENDYDVEPTQLAQFYRKWIMGYWADIIHFDPKWGH
jgi:AcrR family transcriptional regulator